MRNARCALIALRRPLARVCATGCSQVRTSSAWRRGFPLTRPIARRARHASCSICAPASSIRRCCSPACGSSLFEILADGPLRPRNCRARLALPSTRRVRLLRAAVSLRAACSAAAAGRYGLGDSARRCSAIPASPRWSSITRCSMPTCAIPSRCCAARSDSRRSARYWPYAGETARPRQASRRSETRRALHRADGGLAAADRRRDAATPIRSAGHRCLLDVGGGEGGSFVAAAAAHARNCAACCSTCRRSPSRRANALRAAGLAARAVAHRRQLPDRPAAEGADIVSLVRVLHDHDDARC